MQPDYHTGWQFLCSPRCTRSGVPWPVQHRAARRRGTAWHHGCAARYPHHHRLDPDTDSEQDYLPAPQSLQGALFLADRGYLNLTYLRDVDRHGGFFVVRAKEGLHPRVIDAYREDGKRLRSCQERDFQAILST